MKTRRFLITTIALLGFSLSLAAQYTREIIKENPSFACGVHNCYQVPDYKDTPAPKGYTPFYVSHYGRHGSRFQTNQKNFECVEFLCKLDEAGLLTDAGKAFLADVKALRDAHEGQNGVLSRRGALEHQGIAGRLVKRVPAVFKQRDSKVVGCLSSPVHRCIQSMANFTMMLKAANPELDIYASTREDAAESLLAVRCRINNFESGRHALAVRDSIQRTIALEGFHPEHFVKDIAAAKALLGGNFDLNHGVFSMYVAANISNCLDLEEPAIPNCMTHFTDEQLYNLGRVYNMHCNMNFARSVEMGPLRDTITGRPIIRDIVAKADLALAGNGHCADLRFGHDTGVGPALSLLRVEGYDSDMTLEQTLTDYPAYKYICMGSNLQMIFYHNKKGDVIVKILRNENETIIPSLPTWKGVYYKWDDLRSYMLSL